MSGASFAAVFQAVLTRNGFFFTRGARVPRLAARQYFEIQRRGVDSLRDDAVEDPVRAF